MARLFLSYSREDRHLVEPLATLLERAGHSVWWDRRIAGGSDFSAEIARELSAAAVVLVAWSNASVVSHWVKDEAAEGRDRGRLIPLLLDQATAPLGFRQIQAIDLAGWNGNGRPPAFDELLRAIDLVGSSLESPVPDRPAEPPPSSPTSPSKLPWLLAGIFAVALLAVTVFLLLRQQPAPGVPGEAVPSNAAAAPVPPATEAAANIDGRWRISWNLNGTPYEGVLTATGATARLELDAMTSMGRQSVRQNCSISGNAPIRIACHDVEIVSGPQGYMPDDITLQRAGDDRLTGSLSDPLGLVSAEVTARRE
ncbi:MAG TPA: toll/interleukin-1 receptor domain-containing protein [Allosphingosinicella sp.]|nr:toll/interleukin-1 receptor domain-containing protein [Allosphingosinicella sp.]